MTTLTIHLDDNDEALLRRLASEHKVSPEVLVLNNLRVSMRDYERARLNPSVQRVSHIVRPLGDSGHKAPNGRPS